MKIAVLFDGAGLARLGLEQAGHECTGFELDPYKHLLSQSVGSGNCVVANALDVDLSGYDAVWASPPCQSRSQANTNPGIKAKHEEKYKGYDDLLQFSLGIQSEILWVENVVAKEGNNDWGCKYNAAQFLKDPIQLRTRIIGGRFGKPEVHRPFKRRYKGMGICPAIIASQGQGGYAPKFKRAEGYYGRKMTLEECAYHQGLIIPEAWDNKPEELSPYEWKRIKFEAIGNGVPVYMSKAFGDVY